jgi:hypothetical protein
MIPEQRIKYFIRLSANLLAQLRELNALQEQLRHVQDVAVERQEVVQTDNSRQE